MQKQELKVNKVGYIAVALLLGTYILFPAWYRAVSQKVFSVVYTRHAQATQNNDITTTQTPAEMAGLSPMFVIARPPQTPYDYLITTIPKEYQHEDETAGRWYVYDETVRPIGYVEKNYTALSVVTLFSAPGSDEVFSVLGHVSQGNGEGGGSFSLQVPLDTMIPLGTPIIHQATGVVAATVVVVERVAEKNIQKVIGVLPKSPMEIAVLYRADKPSSAVLQESIESVIDAATALSADAQKEQEGQEKEEPDQQDTQEPPSE